MTDIRCLHSLNVRCWKTLATAAGKTIIDRGCGEIAFGALQAGLDIEYSCSSVGFTWEGFDEMDEVSGDRRAGQVGLEIGESLG